MTDINHVLKIAAFMEEFHPCCRQWKNLMGWIMWHLSHGYLATAFYNKDELEILGMCVIRPVDSPGDGLIHYHHNPDGQCLFIELFIARQKEAYQLLALTTIKRFGKRKKVAYFRGTETSLRVKDYDVFKRNVTRGKLTETPVMEFA